MPATYNITGVKDELAGMFRGTTVNKITNINSLFRRAARKVLSKIDPAPTKRIAQVTLFDEVYTYSAPDDVKGNKVTDIRPQVNRGVEDRLRSRNSLSFDQKKLYDNNLFHVTYESATRRLRVKKTTNRAGSTVNNCESTTANGTWAADGTGATNLTTDTDDFVDGSGSLNFDLASGQSTGYIENSTMSQVDLTDHDEKSSLFAYVYFPDASIITNVILRWGNDTSNYWAVTATTPFDRTAFQNGWNLIRFNWNGATETGTVAPATVDYLRVTITYNQTAETDIRVDKIFSSLGEIWEIEYYSELLFRTTGGTWGATVSTDSDLVNLDIESYNLFLDECALEGAYQMGGADLTFDVTKKERDLVEGYRKYKEEYPSEKIIATESYYRVR